MTKQSLTYSKKIQNKRQKKEKLKMTKQSLTYGKKIPNKRKKKKKKNQTKKNIKYIYHKSMAYGTDVSWFHSNHFMKCC
jgi:hypothetical protein